MAEIGFVTCATIALHVGQAALPAYRSKFSKHQFTQPQLLAILCLMRDEDWTVREAEVRLAEHMELRTALRLQRVPDYTTVYRFLRRLNETALDDTLSAVIQRLGAQSDSQATVAVDATGLAPGAISTFFVKRAKDRGEGFTWRHWLKWTIAVISTIVSSWRRRPDAARPMTVPSYVRSSAWPMHGSPLAWSWPMRSSTVSATISMFVRPCRPRVSFRPSGAGRTGGFRAYEPRCARHFPWTSIAGVR
jgi:hypothetical protein